MTKEKFAEVLDEHFKLGVKLSAVKFINDVLKLGLKDSVELINNTWYPDKKLTPGQRVYKSLEEKHKKLIKQFKLE